MFTCPERVELPLINYKPRLVNYSVVCDVRTTPHFTPQFFSCFLIIGNSCFEPSDL